MSTGQLEVEHKSVACRAAIHLCSVQECSRGNKQVI